MSTTLPISAVLPGLEARPDVLGAVEQLRRFIADRDSFGPPTAVHLSLSPRRRSCWLYSWKTIPLTARRDRNGTAWCHELLPRWEYSWPEVKAEMLPDLEHLAATGEQPKQATRPAMR